nr:hypothetical protein [uncultured Noviherbaspirillum sp.]
MKNFTQFFFVFLLCLSAAAFAAPGAHGPDGEHLDAPGGGGHAHGTSGPRVETFTASFELVGQLQGGELSILVDRYETNEPVLNGKLEVETNGLKAAARFHADHGDYSVDDEKFLQALAVSGKHALVFRLTAGEESGLMEGTLEVDAADRAHGDDHAHSLTRWSVASGLLALVLTALAVRLLRRQSRTGK